jgi:hypothetical protein
MSKATPADTSKSYGAIDATPKKITNLERLKAELLAEIEERGIVHVFEWMHGWFDRVAEAQIRDQMADYLAPHGKDQEAINLYLMERMMCEARSVSNHSTSASANLMRQARVSVMAQMIDRNYEGYASGHQRRKATDAFYERPDVAKRTQKYIEQAQAEADAAKQAVAA